MQSWRVSDPILGVRNKNCVLINDRVSAFVRSEEGTETQRRLWSELSEKLEKIQPGVMSRI